VDSPLSPAFIEPRLLDNYDRSDHIVEMKGKMKMRLSKH
jgi:hypothetical protein